LSKKPVESEFLGAMLELLQDAFGFRPTEFTMEGFPVKAVNENGDVFSFETSFNTLEFSMGQKKSIIEVADHFYLYLRALKKLEKRYNHLICGMGINPYAQYADSRPLNTPSMLAKSEFMKTFTTHLDSESFHTFSASTQTHIEVKLPKLPVFLNLLEKLSFVDAMLFANSLPFPYQEPEWKAKLPSTLQREMHKPDLCFRDTLWRLCEAPNTAALDRTYGSVDDIAAYLMELKVFIVGDGRGGLQPIRPVKFSDYFQDGRKPEEDIAYFRSLAPAAVSKYGTIEIRQTCTQPLSKVFMPSAFYAGLVVDYQSASDLVDEFMRENGIQAAGSILRHKAAHQETIAPREKINTFIMNLLEASRRGLKKRSFGEEKFLEGVTSPEGFIECPAEKQLHLREQGLTCEEIMFAFSEVGDS